jgi:hypothetical protein
LGKSSQKLWAISVSFQKLPKAYYLPLGENSPILVTLFGRKEPDQAAKYFSIFTVHFFAFCYDRKNCFFRELKPFRFWQLQPKRTANE